MAAGLDQATIELLGLRGSLSEPDPERQKVVVFLTDGLPSLPTGYESYDVRAVVRAAERARRAGVKVNTFAIGPEALSGPVATVEMARRTGGSFTPVRNPADIVSMIEGVSLVDLAELRVRNLTTGKDAAEVELRLDGGFAALLDLAPGRNRIEVYARASDGSETRREITLQYAPGAPLPPLPPSLVATKNLLLERRLTTLKQVGLGIEREQAERTRGELELEIQRERRQAEERATTQRRELRIDVEPGAAAGGTPARRRSHEDCAPRARGGARRGRRSCARGLGAGHALRDRALDARVGRGRPPSRRAASRPRSPTAAPMSCETCAC